MTVHRCDQPTADGTPCANHVDDTTATCAAGHPNRRFRPATPAAAPVAAGGGAVADVDDLVATPTPPTAPPAAKVIRGGPYDSRRIPIGTLHVPAGVTVTEDYEVVAWNPQVELEPGDYDVVTNGYWVIVSIPGTTVSKHTPSLIAGVAIASHEPQDAGHRDVGRPATYSVKHYAYHYANQVAEQLDSWAPVPGATFEAAPNITAVSHAVHADGVTATIWDLAVIDQPPDPDPAAASS